MKKIILLTSLLSAGIAVSSCTSDDNELFGSKNEVKKIEALICDFEEDADGSSTRTSYTYGSNGYEAVWTEGDILGIYPLGGDQVSFPISKGAGSKTAFFDGGAWALRGTYKYAAYYPFSTDNYTIKETAIPVSYIGQEQKGNNTTAHLSAYDFMAAAATKPSSNGSVTLPFKHLGAFLSMSLTLPKAGTYTSLTLTSDQGEFITGGTVDLSASEPSITAVSKSTSVTLGLNSITLDSGDPVLKVNMMIAPADMTGSTIEIKVTDSEGVSYINSKKAWTCTSAFAANTTIKVSRSLESSGGGEGDNKPEGSETPYLTFCANETQTVKLNREVPTLEYSVNNGEWTELGTNVVTFGGSSGDLRLRGKSVIGTAVAGVGEDSRTSFVFGNSSIEIECKGDIRTLIDYENCNTVRTDRACFAWLFYQTPIVSAPALPATQLAWDCYSHMFYGCTSLSSAPALPATQLASSCYYQMFEGCTSLSSAPALPATQLASHCYYEMFDGCTSLSSAPALPATELANNCYSGMFGGCTSLSSAPALPATELAQTCYSGMFWHCTSLSSAPALPATQLAKECYFGMFNGCTSLSSAPALPAIKLAYRCYSHMFNGCTSLSSAPALPATQLAESCYFGMFYDCNKLSYVKMMATDISAGDCLTGWLDVVARSGTFVKNSAATWDVSGVIPSGWTVQTAIGSGEGDNKPEGSETPYLTFCANETQTVQLNREVPTLEYSVNNGEWAELGTNVVTFGGLSGDLRLRGKSVIGTAVAGVAEDSRTSFVFGNRSIEVECKGDIRTLIDYENYNTERTDRACFAWLFYQTPIVSAPALPATELADRCYLDMFAGCTSLSSAPALPATQLATLCYSYMFDGCTSLSSAPSLPSTQLAFRCYLRMFDGCTSLSTAPALRATQLADGCYEGMFYGCTSLSSAPALPATQLADYCYNVMFEGCTSLSSAPALPATELAQTCYSGMFKGCTSLSSAPALPATELAEYCYRSMFYGCTSLSSAPALPATQLAECCYSFMFDGCTSLSSAPALPATQLASSCYSYMFGGCTSLSSAPALPATQLAPSCYSWMFNGCDQLSYVKMMATDISASSCLTYWLNGVASSGTFVKNSEATWNESEVIPSGWTVQTAIGSGEEDNKPEGSETPYLTFCANETQTVKLNREVPTLEYSVNNGEWAELGTNVVTFGGSSGDLRLRGKSVIGTAVAGPNEDSRTSFVFGTRSIKVECKGDIRTLIDYENYNTVRTDRACFAWLFYNAPIVSAPSLPATQLEWGCYSNMFNGCTSLSSAPALPATELANNCYDNMFWGCESLSSAPALPATELASYCYYYMFSGCTSLSSAPALPATELKYRCYENMFNGCTSLSSAPVLPATQLATGCYSDMFYGCTQLSYVKMMATDISVGDCLTGWLDGVASSGTFVKNSAATWNESEVIPSGWTVQTAEM